MSRRGGHPHLIARLDVAVVRYRAARDGFIRGATARLWRELGAEWTCSAAWAQRQVRRHMRGCDEWDAALADGLIAPRCAP